MLSGYRPIDFINLNILIQLSYRSLKKVLLLVSVKTIVNYVGPLKQNLTCMKQAWIFTQKAYRMDQSAFIGGRNLLRVCRARTGRVIARPIAKRTILVPFVFVVPFPNLNNRW